MPEPETAAAEDLISRFLDGAEPAERARLTRADVAGAVAALSRLATTRAPGAAAVRVANPTRAADGWDSPHTVVQIVDDDMPFLIDSVSNAIGDRGYDIHLLLHPIVVSQSYIHLEIDRETDTALLNALRHDLEVVLADVRVVVADWHQMRERALTLGDSLRRAPPSTVHHDEAAEASAFLSWLADDHFTFIGYCDYQLVDHADDVVAPVEGSQLGLARRRLNALPDRRTQVETRHRPRAPFVLTLTKAPARSTVHRSAQLDYVGVKRFDGDGTVVGEWGFTGLYTASVYSESTAMVPVIRRKIAIVLDRAGLPPKGHDGRALVRIIETFPRDELFRLPVDELFDLAMGILGMGERRRLRLFVSHDDLGQFVSCLVYLPREQYTTLVRMRILSALQEAFGGTDAEFTVLVSDAPLARLHVIVKTPDGATGIDTPTLEARMARLVRVWVDDLRDALIAVRGEEAGLDTLRAWSDAFSASYQFDVTARDAVFDIEVLETLAVDGDLRVRVVRNADGARVHVKLYRSGSALLLSDVMPLLAHLGVTVIDERPYEVQAANANTCWIYSFGVAAGPDDPLTDPRAEARVADLFIGVWAGDIENDGLNRLVLGAGLGAREVVVVRALCKYLRQAGVRITEEYLAATLAANPAITKLAVDLFTARFDPDSRDHRTVERISTELTAAIDAVESLDEDRILRALVSVVHATTRTNAYQRDRSGAPKAYVAVKLDPTQLAFLPAPRPCHEIWVYSPRVEGVHLRAGDIARGGIRWSDRREDFRTEVLGLMKAQTVKNAVIVPVGAKGGFVAKQTSPTDDRAATEAEVLACYRVFVRGLLDITDNQIDNQVITPERVVRYDGDDPYLVVAADKGTASFSDEANQLATEYGYWLGDAFASGGSSGFDHKAMGITSRGAWISVRAHFRALGVDADAAELSVVGIGDMSGDVFGNGMLRSSHLKLIAAFDHRHVFVDPDPHPQAASRERRRLFELPSSSWADFDATVISSGGAVFSRAAKSVSLSAEAQRALGVDRASLTPDELVSAILRAPVDLLWNGGIGTFVKASAESHVDVGDRTNDSVRVDADELRCRVVAEGGNLGLTQRARVEFALAGGRVNTDAIDNSAGVDCSDHEVNIKILLERAIHAGHLDRPARNAVLGTITEDVAELVLADNEAQANALAIALVEAPSMIGVHARQIERLEQSAHLDRALEGLPGPKALQERHATGLGLTAPELAVLLAYTKLEVERELMASDVPDDQYLHRDFVAYFPTAVRDRCGGVMDAHPLRRAILSTVVANAVVNRAGISFLSRLADETGLAVPVLVRAHVCARDLFEVATVWTTIDELDRAVTAPIQDAMFLAVRRLVERSARWLVRHSLSPGLAVDLDLGIGPTVERFAPGVRAVMRALPELISGEAAIRFTAEVTRLAEAGAPADLAAWVAGSEVALAALPMTELAIGRGDDPVLMARVHFALADRLDLDWLRDRIAALPRDDRWQTEARAALRDDFHDAHEQLTAAVLDATDPAMDAAARVDAWISAREADVARYRSVVADIDDGGTFDLATLAVARRALRDLV
ncbi:MAG TPA: NAD-glutamate dehydrogenase [Acidimicrobiia bacterium]